jgi:hypothetical protein
MCDLNILGTRIETLVLSSRNRGVTLVVDAYSGMELCTPIWLNHDYRDGGVMHILAVAAYSRVEVCTPIFLVRLAIFFG